MIMIIPDEGLESRSIAVAKAPFPLPASRTLSAVSPHPAFGQESTENTGGEPGDILINPIRPNRIEPQKSSVE